MMTRTLSRRLAALASLLALAVAPLMSAAAQDRNTDEIRPTVVELGRLKFISSAGDVGGTASHPDGTARLWNYNPDSRALTYVEPGVGRILWRSTVPEGVNLLTAQSPHIVGGGRLVLFSARDKVVAFSGADGSYLWTFNNPDVRRPFNIAAVNAVPDVVVLWRTQQRRQGQEMVERTLALRGIDATTGKVKWELNDENAEGTPLVWRQYISHNSMEAKNVPAHTDLLDVRTGEIAFTCDFLPQYLNDLNLLTARYRKGMQRSQFFLPDASGKFVKADLQFAPELKIPVADAGIIVPPIDAPVVQVVWSNETNKEFAKRTFLVKENGTAVNLRYLPVPDNYDIYSGRLVGNGHVFAAICKDTDLQYHLVAVDLRQNALAFTLRLNDVPRFAPEPDVWPVYGIMHRLVDAGKNIGLLINLDQPRLTTLRIVDPYTGASSKPRVVNNADLPVNLTGGDFGYLDNDELVVCTAGKSGNLTAEPADGEPTTMAKVLGEAQRWLISQQQRNGSFLGRQTIVIGADAYFITATAGEDIATTALAGLALVPAASDEFDEFRLSRRAALRKAINWVIKQQNSSGYFAHAGRGSFIDHCMALEFLVRAMPANEKDTTGQHRDAVKKGLEYTKSLRHAQGGWPTRAVLPKEFTIPQAPGMDGEAIARELSNRPGDLITLVLAHRVFRAASEHPALRQLVGNELQKNVEWVVQVITNVPEILQQPTLMALLLSETGGDMPANMKPNQRITDIIMAGVPQAIKAGRRGRLESGWWFIMPDAGRLVAILGEDGKRLRTQFESWACASRHPEGQHHGQLGPAQCTALAALAAASLDSK